MHYRKLQMYHLIISFTIIVNISIRRCSIGLTLIRMYLKLICFVQSPILHLLTPSVDLNITYCFFVQCLTAENVADILRIDVSVGFDETNFEKATTIIVAFLAAMEDFCPQTPSMDWLTLDYHNFTEVFMHYDDDHDHRNVPSSPDLHNEDSHDHNFTLHQMEFLMRDMNASYRVGNIVVQDGNVTSEEDKQEFCFDRDAPVSMKNSWAFRIGNVINKSVTNKLSVLTNSIVGVIVCIH